MIYPNPMPDSDKEVFDLIKKAISFIFSSSDDEENLNLLFIDNEDMRCIEITIEEAEELLEAFLKEIQKEDARRQSYYNWLEN